MLIQNGAEPIDTYKHAAADWADYFGNMPTKSKDNAIFISCFIHWVGGSVICFSLFFFFFYLIFSYNLSSYFT